MDKNEIKKVLYKEKPMANRIGKTIEEGEEIHGIQVYQATSSLGIHLFAIPDNEADGFGICEPAQLLIRWLRI